MRFSFDIGFAFHDGASLEVNAEVLRLCLEFLIAVDREWLRGDGRRVRKLYDFGVDEGRPVVYDRTRVWYSTPDLYVWRKGDCKTLTAARVAELREEGVPASPVFRHLRVRDVRTGAERVEYHILVQREGPRVGVFGRRKLVYEDPSLKLGMDRYYKARGMELVAVQ